MLRWVSVNACYKHLYNACYIHIGMQQSIKRNKNERLNQVLFYGGLVGLAISLIAMAIDLKAFGQTLTDDKDANVKIWTELKKQAEPLRLALSEAINCYPDTACDLIYAGHGFIQISHKDGYEDSYTENFIGMGEAQDIVNQFVKSYGWMDRGTDSQIYLNIDYDEDSQNAKASNNNDNENKNSASNDNDNNDNEDNNDNLPSCDNSESTRCTDEDDFSDDYGDRDITGLEGSSNEKDNDSKDDNDNSDTDNEEDKVEQSDSDNEESDNEEVKE